MVAESAEVARLEPLLAVVAPNNSLCVAVSLDEECAVPRTVPMGFASYLHVVSSNEAEQFRQRNTYAPSLRC